MAVLVRASRDEDVPAIAAIYDHAVTFGTASFELVPPTLAEMAARRAALIEGGFPYLVAEADGSVLGYAYAGLYRARPAYRTTVEDSVYVAPDRQGSGIGLALMAELIATCEARGFRQIVAVIGDSASRGSIALHQRTGFRHVGTLERVGYKHGRWLDSVLMQRALGPPGDAAPAF
jgi:L-amino acid N-acyltransferase YncA